MKSASVLFGFCFLSFILGLGYYISGLLTITSLKLSSASVYDLLKGCHPAIEDEICEFQENAVQSYFYNHSQKVIIILIDALRADFIRFIKYNEKFNVSMPFTEVLLKNGSALSFITQGFAPTVTLPRIKTLLTGTISNFVDILLNFNAFELDNDNILKQASSNGFKSIFYGDDTWLKMFPNLFIRSEGTHSFFVSDFKEVDFNVSRHIKHEINKTDWNILILHFLGVDHIGHSYGPFSEHLLPKLLQMDDIVKFIYENINKTANSPLIILCGDHGMTNSGSHGGVTQNELLTPLIFISTNYHSFKKSDTDIKQILDQVDFAPTFSAILGIPIPSNSYGQIIFDVLKFTGFSNEEVLYAAYVNLLQMSKVYESIFPLKTEHLSMIKEITKNHYKWLKSMKKDVLNFEQLLISYEKILYDMKNDLLNVISAYDDFSMVLGILIMWIATILFFHTLFIECYNVNNFNNVSYYKMTSVMSIMLPVTIVSYQYFNSTLKIIITLLFICFGILIYQTYFLLSTYFWDEKAGELIGKTSVLFLVIHAFSLLSSSFIEEEHQTWYYFSCSLPILICLKKSALFTSQLTNKNICKTSFLTKYYLTFLVLFLVLHRIFRKWNQVGNKWLYMPDITNWLNQKEHAIYLVILTISAQFILILYFRIKLHKFSYVMFTVGLILISAQKLNSLVFFSFLEHHTETMLIPWVTYLFSICIIFSSLLWIFSNPAETRSKKAKKFIFDFVSAWILLTEIIGRIHNIPLIVNVILQEYLLSKITWEQNCDITVNVISYFMMAMTSFFYYGNSNSLSTIDVFSGYTGVLSYKPIFVGFLIVCNTYSTYLMWLIFLFYRIILAIENFKNLKIEIRDIFLFLLDYKLFILSLYCTVMFLMRHHLFIFSVFFPKLFYEVSHTLSFTIILIFISFMIKIL